ncbi:MAG TPA: SDR family NAD(P)-dependent oxidoreductase [Chitinophagaceae bacterium]|jgi:gluconate 5-dehydrogenase
MDKASFFSLAGKQALVTGGGTGIGYGISNALAAAGAHVILLGRREDVLKKAAAEIGPHCRYVCYDMNDRKEMPALIDGIEKEYGPIDILVNNAGAHLKKPSLDTTDEEFDHVLQVNLASAFTLTRECVRHMQQRRTGAVVFISSMTGLFGMDKVIAYGTSKTALIGMMRMMVTEYSGFNVRVNTIAPGWIQSDMLDTALNADEARKNKIINRIPYKSFGTGEDIGMAAVYLCSEAARYVTGVVLPVDGGAAYAF